MRAIIVAAIVVLISIIAAVGAVPQLIPILDDVQKKVGEGFGKMVDSVSGAYDKFKKATTTSSR